MSCFCAYFRSLFYLFYIFWVGNIVNLCSLCLFARNRGLHKFLFNIAGFGAELKQNREHWNFTRFLLKVTRYRVNDSISTEEEPRSSEDRQDTSTEKMTRYRPDGSISSEVTRNMPGDPRSSGGTEQQRKMARYRPITLDIERRCSRELTVRVRWRSLAHEDLRDFIFIFLSILRVEHLSTL